MHFFDSLDVIDDILTARYDPLAESILETVGALDSILLSCCQKEFDRAFISFVLASLVYRGWLKYQP